MTNTTPPTPPTPSAGQDPQPDNGKPDVGNP